MSENTEYTSRMRNRMEEFGEDQSQSYAWEDKRSLKYGQDEIENLCDELDLPDEVETFAKSVYEQCHEKDMVRGRSIEAVVCSTVYIACRLQDIPRSIDEIADKSRISRDKITRTYKEIAKDFGYGLEPVDPETFLEHIADNLEFNSDEACEHVVEFAREILEKSKDANMISGRSPSGCAGAAIYTAARKTGNNMTQSQIADAAEVSEVTVRNRYHEQLEVLDSE